MSLVPTDSFKPTVDDRPEGGAAPALAAADPAAVEESLRAQREAAETDRQARQVAELRRQVRAYDSALAALDAEAASLEAGTHPEYVARSQPLLAQCDARMARAARDHEAELAALDRLRDAEVEASAREVRRRVEALEEKLADARGEKPEGASRSLRSKDDGKDGRRSPARRGPNAPASSLLDTMLTETEAADDFVAIATAHGAEQLAA
mmetsp:Transcript_36783/g.113786  ORF Transcript_36783/g.113786 Transcript_36783/m.113786 type:complete len:209 (+) Transcript_36783:478-1104(+)